MAALDKLLKSNELNFAFLALGPSLFVVYLFFTWVKNIWWNKDTLSGRRTNVEMRESLRYVLYSSKIIVICKHIVKGVLSFLIEL